MPSRTKDAAKANPANPNAIKARVMPILLLQHNVAALPVSRRDAKEAKLEGFVDRAIGRGLTLTHVEENLTLGRPPHWIESGD